jgi:hypothetical protein
MSMSESIGLLLIWKVCEFIPEYMEGSVSANMTLEWRIRALPYFGDPIRKVQHLRCLECEAAPLLAR